jgi:predicted PurR-regulated permease PerM
MVTLTRPPDDASPAKLRETTLLLERLVVLLLFAGLLLGVALILRPFVTSILFGTILVLATWPLREWLMRKGLSRSLTSVALLLLAIACVAMPAIVVAPRLSERLVEGTQRVQAFLAAPPETPSWIVRLPLVGKAADGLWLDLIRREGALQELLKPYWTEGGKAFFAFGRAFAESVIEIVLSLAVAVMFWLRGDVLAQSLRDISERLGGASGTAALKAAADSVRGVAYGIVGTAGIQAVALTIGLLIAGVPGAGLLGFLALLIALSQIGILLVVIWGGAAWWLFSTGYHGWAVFMLVWGLCVSIGDNVIRPWLVSFGAATPVTLVFLGVLGGFIAFGFLGLFIGPTLLAVLFGLVRAWQQSPTAKVDVPI